MNTRTAAATLVAVILIGILAKLALAGRYHYTATPSGLPIQTDTWTGSSVIVIPRDSIAPTPAPFDPDAFLAGR